MEWSIGVEWSGVLEWSGVEFWGKFCSGKLDFTQTKLCHIL